MSSLLFNYLFYLLKAKQKNLPKVTALIKTHTYAKNTYLKKQNKKKQTKAFKWNGFHPNVKPVLVTFLTKFNTAEITASHGEAKPPL